MDTHCEIIRNNIFTMYSALPELIRTFFLLRKQNSKHFNFLPNLTDLIHSLAWFIIQKYNELHYHFWQAKYSSKVIAIDVQFWLNLGTTMTQYQWKSWLSVSMNSSMEKTSLKWWKCICSTIYLHLLHEINPRVCFCLAEWNTHSMFSWPRSSTLLNIA